MYSGVDPFKLNKIGRTSVEVTKLGFGGGTMGDPDEIIPEVQAEATLSAAYDAGVRLFDTAPWYGNTKSEHRVGHHLRQRPRADFRLTTKVGRVYSRPADPSSFDFLRWKGGLHFDLRFDYTRDGILRSYEQSLQRLGINTVDALVIHDLDWRHQKSEAGVQTAFKQLIDGGGFEALAELRSSGEIGAIGAGMNFTGLIPRFLEYCDIDYFLMAMPYTLLDQPALDEDLPLCEARGVGIVIGAVFASGILATGPTDDALYAYQPAEDEVMTKARGIANVCERHGVPLPAAALQFPLHHPAVATVIPGANSPAQVEANVAAMGLDIPDDLWIELKSEGLIREDAPTP
jgi:D-threo-aldose 1-dehydrogenase